MTGGARGIGRAIVKCLAADGATVVFSYLRNEAAWWPRFGWISGHNLSADGDLLP